MRVEGGPAPEADLTRALYEQYANQIFRYCLHQLGSREEAEDAVQSTFLNAFRGIKRGVVPELESAWLFKIAHNVCLSRRRTSWRRGRIESPTDFDVVEELTPAPTRRSDELIGLQDVLEQMPENQRRAILLREWQGLSYREISDELELSQAAVETLIFRARRALASGLEQPPKAKRRAMRGLDLGNVVAGIKSLLLGGGAAVKVAATVAVVSATTVVAAAPVQQHRARVHAPKPVAHTRATGSSQPAPAEPGRSVAGPATAFRPAKGGARSHARSRLQVPAALAFGGQPPAGSAPASEAPVEQPVATPAASAPADAPAPVTSSEPAAPAPAAATTAAQPPAATDTKTSSSDKGKSDTSSSAGATQTGHESRSSGKSTDSSDQRKNTSVGGTTSGSEVSTSSSSTPSGQTTSPAAGTTETQPTTPAQTTQTTTTSSSSSSGGDRRVLIRIVNAPPVIVSPSAPTSMPPATSSPAKGDSGDSGKKTTPAPATPAPVVAAPVVTAPAPPVVSAPQTLATPVVSSPKLSLTGGATNIFSNNS